LPLIKLRLEKQSTRITSLPNVSGESSLAGSLDDIASAFRSTGSIRRVREKESGLLHTMPLLELRLFFQEMHLPEGREERKVRRAANPREFSFLHPITVVTQLDKTERSFNARFAVPKNISGEDVLKQLRKARDIREVARELS